VTGLALAINTLTFEKFGTAVKNIATKDKLKCEQKGFNPLIKRKFIAN